MMNHPEIVRSLKLPRKNYIVSVLLLESRRWVRGAARIARQPSKLKALGSNPSGPATNHTRSLIFACMASYSTTISVNLHLCCTNREKGIVS